jgi:hypothetical protein
MSGQISGPKTYILSKSKHEKYSAYIKIGFGSKLFYQTLHGQNNGCKPVSQQVGEFTPKQPSQLRQEWSRLAFNILRFIAFINVLALLNTGSRSICMFTLFISIAYFLFIVEIIMFI